LQPHFLFNTHNTIVALILKQENDAAIRMLTRLSDLLRISLSLSGQQVVTVREELQTLSLYLDIQRERFRDRLTVDVDAPDHVLDAEIPHLLLQPLVENALLHGLENVTENARLTISVRREGEELSCTVYDNGAGFSLGRATEDSGNGRGMGLANTRERLQQLYGLRQSLAITSTPGRGCRVALRLPLRRRESAAVAAMP
jgi:LytS/YehU family sensor histidine kinase